MNAPHFHSALAGTVLAVLALPIDRHRQPQPPSAVDRRSPVLGEAARGWDAVERQVEGDTVGYQRRASAHLHRTAGEVARLESLGDQPSARQRAYLGTRLQALREHLEYARAELIKLPTSTGDAGFIPAHAHFYRTVQHLDVAMSQVADELVER